MLADPARVERQGQPPVIALVGETATGKTDVGIAIARAFNGEVIGADSRQVYRGMAIGTAQPDAEQLAAVLHHLVGCISPHTPFGLATYLQVARTAIDDICSRHRTPIVVGGTGQYVWAMLEGWEIPRVPPDRALRAELEAEARRRGGAALHARLAATDPAAAARIDARNVRRVIRALEVRAHTGEPTSRQRRRDTTGSDVVIGLAMDRSVLLERIDRRVEAMYTAGLLDEVRALAAAGHTRDLPAMASIGYPEAWAALAGEITTAEAVRRTQLATHRLARHQRAWFKPADPRIVWIDAADPRAAARAVDLVRASLARWPRR